MLRLVDVFFFFFFFMNFTIRKKLIITRQWKCNYADALWSRSMSTFWNKCVLYLFLFPFFFFFSPPNLFTRKNKYYKHMSYDVAIPQHGIDYFY